MSDEPVRILTHPGLCEGWGECHRWGGAVYPLDDDGRIDVHRLEVPAEHALDAWRGAAACPARAITYLGPEPEAADPRTDELVGRGGRSETGVEVG